MSKSRSRLEANPNWKGDNVGYHGIHAWLKRHFGHADRCEFSSCNKKSKVFEWALRKGFKYERKRQNFIRLCGSCHKKYDKDLRKSKKVVSTQFKKGSIPWNKGFRYDEKMRSKLNISGLVMFKKGYIPWNKR